MWMGLAHLACHQVLRGPAVIEERNVEGARIYLADEFADRGAEQIAELRLR
jgi:hypothetical protein